jgi:Tfp pilus assembly protein PilV
MQQNFRNGIAMIELIFALLIMGIVLLSSPMLIQQSIKSSFIGIQQESISAISTHTAVLLTKHWDEKDANDTTEVAPIIELNSELPNSPFKLAGIDNIKLSGRTAAMSNGDFSASPIGVDPFETDFTLFDDIDDYNNVDLNLTVFVNEETTANRGEYIDQNITINTKVTFANDRPNGSNILTPTINAGNTIYSNNDISPNESNIKFIKVNLTTQNGAQELDKNITLYVFSCNLGTYAIGEAEF